MNSSGVHSERRNMFLQFSGNDDDRVRVIDHPPLGLRGELRKTRRPIRLLLQRERCVQLEHDGTAKLSCERHSGSPVEGSAFVNEIRRVILKAPLELGFKVLVIKNAASFSWKRVFNAETAIEFF